MQVIQRSQLQFAYNWTTDKGDNPRLTGTPDSDLLDRTEGYEVLHFLNQRCKTLQDALKAERLIHSALPGSIRGQEHIVAWLNNNWQMYL